MSALLLGVDIGTASTKGVLTLPDGQLVAVARREHPVSRPRPGWVEHDAETIWWSDFVAVCRELTSRASGRIEAVGVSGIGPCVVPCDINDIPLRPAILYGVDTRATDEIAELDTMFGQDAILARCGSLLSGQALGPKLRWLLNNEPETITATKRWHMASSFVVSRLTGEWVLDRHSASQCDPLYDLEADEWAGDWWEVAVPGVPLPQLAWPSEVVGTVRAEPGHATGIPAGTPVIAGTIDAWAEAASVGVRRPGDLMLQYGSTLFMILVSQSAVAERSLWLTRAVDRGLVSIAAGLATGGSLTEWARTMAGRPEFESLIADASRVPAGANGLLVLPYFEGERTPINDPDARGVLIGLTLSHGPEHLYRACLEGTAFAVRHNLEHFSERPHKVIAVGGGTQSQLWLQTVSDVTGLVQDVPRVTLGASYGDALLAAEGVGIIPPLSSWTQLDRTVEPAKAHHRLYGRLYRMYRQLYPATASVQHGLAALREAKPTVPLC